MFRFLESTLRMKAQVDSSSTGWEDFISRERLHEVMQRDGESGGPMGQVRDWIFIACIE
jgi:hypothetical protein